MIKVRNLEEAKYYLNKGATLMYQPYKGDINYIAYNDKGKLMNFNEKLRYPLTIDDITGIMENETLYVYVPNDEIHN
jgi:hypothetical protein